MQDAFGGFCQQVFEKKKKNSVDILVAFTGNQSLSRKVHPLSKNVKVSCTPQTNLVNKLILFHVISS